MTVDLIVLGSGEAAQSVAYPCREAGWSVTVVDSDPFGGTCSLRGCDPKKVLVGVSELVDWTHRMMGKGISAPVPTLVWPDMIRFKHGFVDGVPASNEESFTAAGIRAIQGRAQFVGPTSLRVGDETLVGRHVVVAAGSRHAPLAIPGEEYLTTSTEFLDSDQLPRRVVFVGGGYIAFEFAHVAARADAEVSILHRGDRPLERYDADLVAQLVQITGDLGVDVRVHTTVAGMQGRIVATNLLTGNTRTPNYEGIPTVVFTTPPLAQVGLDEATAQAQGRKFTTHQEDTSGWYSSRRGGLAHSGL